MKNFQSRTFLDSIVSNSLLDFINTPKENRHPMFKLKMRQNNITKQFFCILLKFNLQNTLVLHNNIPHLISNSLIEIYSKLYLPSLPSFYEHHVEYCLG